MPNYHHGILTGTSQCIPRLSDDSPLYDEFGAEDLFNAYFWAADSSHTRHKHRRYTCADILGKTLWDSLDRGARIKFGKIVARLADLHVLLFKNTETTPANWAIYEFVMWYGD